MDNYKFCHITENILPIDSVAVFNLTAMNGDCLFAHSEHRNITSTNHVSLGVGLSVWSTNSREGEWSET